ncbi:Qat anti-phage system TatD family nuclease QatD [Rhizobium sp. NLR22b]|uniref:Qat anti-phage system TatD family nuclease QatD n=1 Tax=Rhizobium sp. NLR22b TaxID=2731115 RepID=UPI001C82A7DC|nr:Qat anti-phage system TatD family nuclease QatD [Rhizobium sp. NLR22b]MBX5242017.1 TatD family hydrolase [Rhizobium sp. NLR22b]
MSEAPSIGGVDFHCHLDLYPDHAAAIARAEAARIYTLTVTTTPKAWPRNHELTRHTRYVRAALGLHPQLVAERAAELPLWERHLTETRYVGEVGLDAGPRFYKSLEAQRHVFERVLERCAEAGGKILTVHSVRSVLAVLDMIEAHLPRERGSVVLHWFTGSKSDARRAAALGCYFSINAEMTRTDRGRELIGSLPRDRILTETDGPFTQQDGRPTEPHDAPLAAIAVADVLGLSADATTKLIVSNLRALLD